MNRQVILALVLVAIVAAALFLGAGTALAAEPILGDEFNPPPKPPPLFKPLPPGQEKVGTIQTSNGPVTLVQRYDTSGFDQIQHNVAPAVPLVQTATLRPGVAGLFTRRL